MNIAAIMPCRGRADQTAANVRRLLATAGYNDWQLICVSDWDAGVAQVLLQNDIRCHELKATRHGYWRCLTEGMALAPGATHFVNLANDLLSVQHWLVRAVRDYRQMFGDGDGLLGFNGDSHEVEHSCHFLISRSLLDRYGGWPVWYDHNFGDTELCQRAIDDKVYAKSIFAILFHDHPYFGGKDDPVYAEGRAQSERDYRLFEQRRRQGWPQIRS